MRTINPFKQGHAFLIKWPRMLREGDKWGGRLSDQPIKGTSVMNQEKERKREKERNGERGEKTIESKGHEWQLI